jgi:hypothetical protein
LLIVPVAFALALALALAACSGGPKNNTAASGTSTASSGATTSGATGSASASTAAAQPLPSACTLTTPAQLTAILGAAPDAGTPQDYDTFYKTCSWNVVPPGSVNSNAIRLGVVKKTKPTDKGFGVPSQAGNPTPVDGLGDDATFYSKGDAAALTEGALVANKGAISISIDATFGGTGPDSSAVEAALIDVVRRIFTALGA